MAKGYALVPRALFTQAWFRELSDRGKCLAFYVACGPHSNIIGAYPLRDGYIAADLNWSMEETQAVMSELVQSGFVKRFGRGEYLLLCRHRDWNGIANHNVMKAAFKELETLPPDPVLDVVFQYLRPICKRFGEGLPEQLETIRVRLLEPFRNTEAQPAPAAQAQSEPQPAPLAESPPSCNDTPEEDLSTTIPGGTRTGKPARKPGVTIEDPNKRLMIFADKLAKVVPGGWSTIAAAMDNTKPNHREALRSCKTAAKEQLGKGWPKLWPTSASERDKLDLHIRKNSQ